MVSPNTGHGEYTLKCPITINTMDTTRKNTGTSMARIENREALVSLASSHNSTTGIISH
ncbi:hypothetical protein D3C76_760140 [compost metagenome]